MADAKHTETGEPIAWQTRFLLPCPERWTEWQTISKESFDAFVAEYGAYEAASPSGGKRYVRALYASPVPSSSERSALLKCEEALRECRDRFAEYVKMHDAKGASD